MISDFGSFDRCSQTHRSFGNLLYELGFSMLSIRERFTGRATRGTCTPKFQNN